MLKGIPAEDQKRVNKRFINSQGDRGTCRWYGSIEGKKGDFYGLEWDQISRGKHDGQDIFIVKRPGSGSFLSTSSKLAPCEWSRDFLEALKEKYLAKVEEKDPVLLGGSNGIVVETVGWEKIQRKLACLDSLVEVGMSDMMIGYGGEGIDKTCPLVEDIDLSRNLFADLEDVAEICKDLTKLRILRLSFNRFRIPKDNRLANSFKSVEAVTLVETFLSWDEILLLNSCFPSLREIHVGFNELKTLHGISASHFINLHSLNLEHNQISDWKELECLGDLVALDYLNVGNNQIQHIGPSSTFKSLTTLNIMNNQLSTWTDIHLLNQFKNLINVRVSGNPICQSVEAENRLIILTARLDHVIRVGGSIISERGRRDSECYYLSQAHLSISDPDFHLQNPRYTELCKVHGTPTSKKIDRTIADGLLHLYFQSPTGSRLEKRLSKHTTLRVLKTVVARTVWPKGWQKAVRGVLVVTRADADGYEDAQELDGVDDLNSLDYMEVTQGSIFHIINYE